MGTTIKGIILCSSVLITIISVFLSASAGSAQNNNSSKITTKYTLSEFKGNLAIYEENNKKPFDVLDVKLDSLPERDIERIKKGITAYSLNEIYSIAEDYE